MSKELNNDIPEVSTKNTKNEILEAYNAVLAKLSEGKQTSIQDIKKQQDEHETIKKASNLTGEKIAKSIMELKLSTIHELDELEQKMSQEYRQFTNLQTAAKIETKNLQDLYQIKQSADTLTALLLAHREYKEKFEKEKETQKALWVREQETFELSRQEEMEKSKKNRLREEEEYKYTKDIERKKDADAYAARKKSLEQELESIREKFQKEFSEREAMIKSKEDEFKKLQEQAKQFSVELENKVKNAVATTRAEVENYYKHQIDLTTKGTEGEHKLMQQTITTLQAKIKEQDAFIKQLTQKADESTQQVQAIALKAIEGSSNIRFYGAHEDYKKISTTGS